MSIVLEALDVDTVRTLITALAGALFGVITTFATGLVSILRDAIGRRYERAREVKAAEATIVRKVLAEALRHLDNVLAARTGTGVYTVTPIDLIPMLHEAAMLRKRQLREAISHSAVILMNAEIFPTSPARILDAQRTAAADLVAVTSADLRQERLPRTQLRRLAKDRAILDGIANG